MESITIQATSIRIPKKRILQISRVSIRQLLPQHILLPFAHLRQPRFILPVQPPVAIPHRKQNKTLRGQSRYDGYLAADVARCGAGAEGLGAKDVAGAESDEGEGVGCDFLGVAGDVGGVPGEEEHECLCVM